MRVIAIGGGELRQRETLEIDAAIVAATEVKSPKGLFIPTASRDSSSYYAAFKDIYGKHLGCKTDVLSLISMNPSNDEILAAIESADFYYVGGGDTKLMLDTWKRAGVDSLLVGEARKGKVVSGLSAGAICWFKYGNSDSPRFQDPPQKETIRVEGLGLIKASLCPHFDSEKFRQGAFADMMLSTPGVGLGLDNNCAIQFQEDSYRVIQSPKGRRADACAHRIFWDSNGKLQNQKVETSTFEDVRSLLSRS